MTKILPIQSVFDKEIPDDFGNAEYRQERELLIAINEIIIQSDLENPVIRHFLDAAYVDKYISVFGTDKPAWLTQSEHDNAVANAVIAIRMAILRKRLNLSLRRFSLVLSHSDLYKWFCGINRFSFPKVPGKTTIGDLENYMSPHLIEEVERRLLCAVQNEESEMLIEPLDFSQSYFDCTCISANIHHPVDWLLLRDSTRTLMKATARIRKLGLSHRMPVEPEVFISKMNKLSMEMTFAKRREGSKKLRKSILRKMKKLVKKVNDHAMNHLALLENNWQTMNISRWKTEQILKQITNVTGQLAAAIKQAHEVKMRSRQTERRNRNLQGITDVVQLLPLDFHRDGLYISHDRKGRGSLLRHIFSSFRNSFDSATSHCTFCPNEVPSANDQSRKNVKSRADRCNRFHGTAGHRPGFLFHCPARHPSRTNAY